VAQCSIPEQLNLEQGNCEKLNTDIFTFAFINLLQQKLGIVIVWLCYKMGAHGGAVG